MIKVTISGDTGKTTVLGMIKKALEDLGVDCYTDAANHVIIVDVHRAATAVVKE